MSSLFAGQYASRLRCMDCKCTTTEYEAFYSISIDILPAGSGNIYESLRFHTAEKRFSAPGNWCCPQCGEEASKQIIFTRWPQYLVIHFERFTTENARKVKKNRSPLKFPLYNLDLGDFIVRPVQEKTSSTFWKAMTISKQAEREDSYNYNAYAVLLHSGPSLDEGHFRSLVKDESRDRRLEFDNGKSRIVDTDAVSPARDFESSDAYIVFYRRFAPTKAT